MVGRRRRPWARAETPPRAPTRARERQRPPAPQPRGATARLKVAQHVWPLLGHAAMKTARANATAAPGHAACSKGPRPSELIRHLSAPPRSTRKVPGRCASTPDFRRPRPIPTERLHQSQKPWGLTAPRLHVLSPLTFKKGNTHSPAYLTISQYIFSRATKPRNRPSFSSLVRWVRFSIATVRTAMRCLLR